MYAHTKSVIIAVALLTPVMAFGQSDQDIAKCAAKDGDLDRLSCFDELAKAAGLDAPKVTEIETEGT